MTTYRLSKRELGLLEKIGKLAVLGYPYEMYLSEGENALATDLKNAVKTTTDP